MVLDALKLVALLAFFTLAVWAVSSLLAICFTISKVSK
jgi:hypothetical protein